MEILLDYLSQRMYGNEHVVKKLLLSAISKKGVELDSKSTIADIICRRMAAAFREYYNFII